MVEGFQRLPFAAAGIVMVLSTRMHLNRWQCIIDCEHVPDPHLRRFCEQSSQARQTRQYTDLTSTCKWDDAVKQPASYEMYANFDQHMNGSAAANTSQILIVRCRSQISATKVFVADRMRWVSSLSGSWHAYWWEDVGGTTDLLLNFSTLHIVLAFSGTLDLWGGIIAYPPLEMHHLHVQQGPRSQNLYFQSHTETQCDEGRGGTGCLVWRFPFGFGIPLTGALATNAEVVDVRRPGAPSIAFAAEVGILLACDDGLRRYPVSFFLFANPYRAKNLISFKTDTFLHAKHRDTVFWFSARTRSAGVLAGLGFHSHWEWTAQCLLLLAHPKQIGLLSRDLRPTKPWNEVDLASSGLSFDDVNNTLFENLGRTRNTSKSPRLIASFSPKWEYVNKSYSEGWYPRQNMLIPGLWVDKGADLTLVSFHRPLSAAYAVPGYVAMHTGFFAYFVRDDLKVSYDYAKGSTDPRWTWHSTFGGHSMREVFLHGGGPFGEENAMGY